MTNFTIATGQLGRVERDIEYLEGFLTDFDKGQADERYPGEVDECRAELKFRYEELDALRQLRQGVWT